MTHPTDSSGRAARTETTSCRERREADRLMNRLASLEALLRDHQARLRDRQTVLQGELADAGLDTPQKMARAIGTMSAVPFGSPLPPAPCGPEPASRRLARTGRIV